VDNASTDGSVDDLPDDARLSVVRLDQNIGYVRGMNAGWAKSSGDVWIPMNDDVVLAPQFIERALDALESHPEAGAIAPLLRLPGGDEGSEAVVGAEGMSLDMRVMHVGTPVGERNTFKASGACPVLRRSAVEDVIRVAGDGPFDPWFDTYGEDVDLAFRLWSLGWETWFAPGAVASHALSASSARSVFDKRGRLRTNVVAARHANAWRHLPADLLVFSAPLILLGDAVFLVLALARGDLGALVDVPRAWARAARGLPGFIRERRRFRTRVHPDVGRVLMVAHRR
jgi:GT2 family glycosyltransferase